MTWWEAVVLAVVQGLTEFLPVSSSGHLALLQGWFAPFRRDDLAFTILLHLATLVSVLLYYRADFRRIAMALLRRGDDGAGSTDPHPLAGRERGWVGLIVIAMLPTMAVGFLLRPAAVAAYGHPGLIGWFLLITAALLAAPLVWRRAGRAGPITVQVALLVGAIQGLAVLPGISRSGSTIVVAILAGTDDNEAARFSFHLAIPAIVGAAVVEAIGGSGLRSWMTPAAVLGFLVAASTGWFAIHLLVRAVARRRLAWFSLYCAAVGLIVVASA